MLLKILTFQQWQHNTIFPEREMMNYSGPGWVSEIMKPGNFSTVLLSVILLITFIGLPVTRVFCAMEDCQKECVEKCSLADKEGCPVTAETEYLQLDSDFPSANASLKLIPLELLVLTQLKILYNPVAVLQKRHSDTPYITPSLITDIPIEVSCFRI